MAVWDFLRRTFGEKTKIRSTLVDVCDDMLKGTTASQTELSAASEAVRRHDQSMCNRDVKTARRLKNAYN